MTIGFVVNDDAFEVGSPDFLKGVFSTVSYHLEPGGWGSKYPEIMHDLYHGKLASAKAEKALADLHSIRQSLRAIRPVKIIWDIDNPAAPAPWGDAAIPVDRDLSNCFMTSNGKNVFEVLSICLEGLASQGGELTIEPY